MTKRFDRERFAKLMALAESDNDHESLAAVRKAAAMARAAGLSLGEAVNSGSKGDVLGWVTGYEAGVRTGSAMNFEKGRKAGFDEATAAAAEERQKRQSKNEHYARGFRDGGNAERESGDARVAAAQAMTIQQSYRDGYSKGQADAQPAINSAYGRGLHDGQTAVNWAATKRRKRA